MYKNLTVLKCTVLNRGNTPNRVVVTPLNLPRTHFFNCVTVLTELYGLKMTIRGNCMLITTLHLLETHIFKCLTVLTELITGYCVTVLTPIYRRSLTQLTDIVNLEELYV